MNSTNVRHQKKIGLKKQAELCLCAQVGSIARYMYGLSVSALKNAESSVNVTSVTLAAQQVVMTLRTKPP